jgi:hypothetical protein
VGAVGVVAGRAAGAGSLVLAVPTYYLMATAVQHDALANAWAPVALLWMAFGALAGVVFGTAGAWVCSGGWRRTVGTALPGAVLFAEALVLARRDGGAAHRRDSLWTALIEAALGILLIMIVARTARQRLTALATATPLAALGFVGFLLGGF